MNRCSAINVLHVLDHSLPEQSGYAFRSHAILRELQRQGIGLEVITSPKQGKVAEPAEEIDGIRYLRTALPGNAATSGVMGQARTVRSTRRRICDLLGGGAVDVIHAHSPCLNGLASMGHGIPLIYEMRSSWEDAAAAVGTTTVGSLRYRASRALETYVVRRADAVVVICEGLRSELLQRGVAEDKITVVPNALPPLMFDLPDPASVASVRERFGFGDAKVIGFFGSFFEWEGVDELVHALPDVIRQVPGARLLLAGGGRQEPVLRDLVTRLGLDDRVTFAGRVGQASIRDFYGAADIMVYARIPHRLTELVTPIKPLEAMAQNAVVIASDVGGHRELVRHGETGFLYPAGSRRGLAETIIKTLNTNDNLSEIRARARAYVESERRWSAVSTRYVPVYRQCLDRHG